MLRDLWSLPVIAAVSVPVIASPALAHRKPAERAAVAAPVGAPAELRLAVDPGAPQVGQPVRLVVTGAPVGATDYRWDVTGTGAYTVDSGAVAATTTTFASSGPHRVGVEIQTPAGVQRTQEIAEVVAASGTTAATTTTTTGAPTTSAPTTSSAATTPKPSPASHVARASGDPGVTIADFHFSPGTTTVHVGDTVTWSNSGPSPHSATANNGSFNTGVLQKGQSGSHTFSQAGTVTYFCSVHPFMHGTIVVEASTQTTGSQSSGSQGSTGGSQSTTPGTGTGSGASAGSTSTSSPAATTSSSPSTTSSSASLPTTGLSVAAVVLSGLVLLGAGLAVRRVLTADH